MPVLKNARHEQFAQALAKGKTAAEAYELAGYVPNPKNGDRLKGNEGIKRRVRDILSKAADKAEWSAADRLAALKRIHGATEGGDPRTAIAAIAEANKMQGAYPPSKHQLAGANGGPVEIDLKNVPTDQLAGIEAALVLLAGAASGAAADGESGEG
jgi:phage terminase small subunit